MDISSSLTYLILGGAIIVSLVISEAVRYWVRSFKPDHCKEAVENSERILEKLGDQEYLKTEILLQLKEIAVCQKNTARILERLADRLDR